MKNKKLLLFPIVIPLILFPIAFSHKEGFPFIILGFGLIFLPFNIQDDNIIIVNIIILLISILLILYLFI